MKLYETRDIIYGFITYDDWEREIINHPVFQRLRRIKQLSLTDMVYPGANHTRFEHSLGVMHLSTLFFDSILNKRKQFLKEILNFNEAGLERDRKIIRFAALLHDIGHSPFSHTGEELMPYIPEDHPKYKKGEDKRFSHEDYSIAVIKTFFKDIIENYKDNDNYDIKVEDVTALLGDETVKPKRSHVWKNIISSQLDADRADYLLRDSLHLGISYGIYDKERLVNTMSIATDPETYSTNLAVEEGGWHVAESLVIARYHMFTQVYFHKTRRAFDHHIENALKEILLKHGDRSGFFPPPDGEENLKKYLEYDDWTMYGLLKEGLGGEHGKIILERKQDKCVFQTSEVPDEDELDRFEDIYNTFRNDISFEDSSEKSWYKTGKEDIFILCNPGEKCEKLEPLSLRSSIVRSMQPIKQKRLYVKNGGEKIIREKIEEYLERKR
ncbi:HD domain-containing protein [Thermoclostridium stercorarium]|uniref:HD domain-containing protein n=1 Tax=Thermoclostridium stercorarium TaxID=1510 RepID=UPI00224932F9|nr:HD domain-containing protein [Thermoclostridium stercorarium]UZQ84750.1 HD domain-containing protein [Thermoclostridium stercorarium]